MVKRYERHISKLVAPDPKLERPRLNGVKRVYASPDDFISESFNQFLLPTNDRPFNPHITFYSKPKKRNLDGGVSKHAVLSAETHPHGRVLFSYGMPIALKTNEGGVQAIPYHRLPTVTTKRHSGDVQCTIEVPYIPNNVEECWGPTQREDVREYHTDRVAFFLNIASKARANHMIERALERAARGAVTLRRMYCTPTEPLITQFVTLKKIALWKLVKQVEIPPILWEKK